MERHVLVSDGCECSPDAPLMARMKASRRKPYITPCRSWGWLMVNECPLNDVRDAQRAWGFHLFHLSALYGMLKREKSLYAPHSHITDTHIHSCDVMMNICVIHLLELWTRWKVWVHVKEKTDCSRRCCKPLLCVVCVLVLQYFCHIWEGSSRSWSCFTCEYVLVKNSKHSL